MKSKSTRGLVLNGLMIALVFLTTYFTKIPTPLPGGYFNLGDVMIMAAGLFLGASSGFTAGAIGSALADVAFGAFIFAPVTFVVKGIEGFVTGKLSGFRNNEGLSTGRVAVSVIAGAIVMVAGYFFAEAFILGLFDKEFGVTAALTELVPNLMQGGISAVVAWFLAPLLKKISFIKE